MATTRPRLKKRADESGRNGRRRDGRFTSGNRAAAGNRTRSQQARLRAAMLTAVGEELDEVIQAVLRRATCGDIRAARLVLEHALGKPRPAEREAEELIQHRLAELLRRVQSIKPRPGLQEPDAALIKDAGALAELGLTWDAIADLVGVDHEDFKAWAEDHDDFAQALHAGGSRYRLRLAVQAERQSLSVLAVRDPGNFERKLQDQDNWADNPDTRFI